MEVQKFNFWQDHSRQYLEMAFRFDRRKTINNPDGYGKKTGSCGDTVEMFLIVRNDRIESVFYEIDGCRNTNACANTVAELSEGKTVDEAWEIMPDDVIDYLKTLPKENYHCAELSMGAFYLALASLQKKKTNT